MSGVLWSPSTERMNSSLMASFFEEVKKNAPNLKSFSDLHSWSVENSELFHQKLFSFFDLDFEGSLAPACTDFSFKSYSWFPNVSLNYAKNLLRHKDSKATAIHFVHESGGTKKISYRDLYLEVAKFQGGIKKNFSQGDTLACYMPNIPETAVSMLAATGLGGSFTSTSIDFGVTGVVDRFSQSKPKILVAAIGYEYGGKYFSAKDKIKEIVQSLDFLEQVIIVDFLDKGEDFSDIPKSISYDDFLSEESVVEYVNVPFSAPLFVMYSSGTTGKPKCIVHSHGGTLLQHVKELGLHSDLKKEKKIFYFTTCGWMMWNWLISSLSLGAEVYLYEGSPAFPSLKEFVQIVDQEEIEIFGTSPKFLRALEDHVGKINFKFSKLETILSTGAPLLDDQFDYVYQNIKPDVQLASICGGTDIIGCFMLGNPLSPVRRGEIQGLSLGMATDCVDSSGNSVRAQEGELVCRKSFPSRPIYFLGDESGERIRKAYFDTYEGLWHHGDFIKISDEGGVSVFGRSDATLNPGGVRIGTSEIYAVTEGISYLADSICVGKQVDGDVDIILFVKMNDAELLDETRTSEIKKAIKLGTTPRHVPRKIIAVSDIPYTRSGKKMELAVTRLLAGKQLTNLEAVANPECLDSFKV